jgi:hypothetical protein
VKLWKAPAIVGNVFDIVPTWTIRSTVEKAADKIRREYDAAIKDGEGLTKIAQDIWAASKAVGIHTDGTKRGYWVFGVVLINDPGLLLLTKEVLYDLPVGTIYAIDGRSPHGALPHNEVKDGLFGFLAWDVDKNVEVTELIADFEPSLDAWNNDIPRIDVSHDARSTRASEYRTWASTRVVRMGEHGRTVRLQSGMG